MATIELVDLKRSYGDVQAVDGVSLCVNEGEFVAIVGPTGCGKTTFLRLIAGLDTPTSGDIRFDGTSVLGVPPNERRVRMVFQGLALYPHMRTFQEKGGSNLGFPLSLRGIKGDALRDRIAALAARVGIAERLFPRKPREMSSGEQQKVALGRALALPPRALLLDEPFSNLDAVSRHKAQQELLAEHAREGTTTLHVTHSLSEAFVLATRIVVMNEGRFVQVGTPDDLRHRPKTELVKDLVEASRGI